MASGKMKRRMVAVGGIIAIVLILSVAIIGGNSSARVVSVSDVANSDVGDAKLQVTGVVVDNSYTVDEQGILLFSIRDEEDESGTSLRVSFDKGVSATFGNGVTAICTGRLDETNTLVCTELVTKCPSKYENATDALEIEQLLDYGTSMLGKTAKVHGVVRAGTLTDATSDVRLTLADAENPTVTLDIRYSGALSSEVQDDSALVITGALDEDGSFLATDVALEE